MSYYMLIEPKTEVKGKVIKKANKADESMIGPKSIDKLRIFKSQNAMVLNYCCKEFRAVE